MLTFVQHANRLTQIFRHDICEPEVMPRLGPEIGRRQNKICPHHARKPIETRSNWPSLCETPISAVTTASGVAGFGVLTRMGTEDISPDSCREWPP